MTGSVTIGWQVWHNAAQSVTGSFFGHAQTDRKHQKDPPPTPRKETSPRLNPDEIESLRSNVNELLSTPGCEEFIAALIRQAAADEPSNPYHDTDVKKLFNIIESQNGFIYGNGFGTAKGYIRIGREDASVFIGGYQPVRSKANVLGEAETALHEIIHHAGKYLYIDTVLARAVIEIRRSRNLPVPDAEEIRKMMAPGAGQGPASAFWNSYLRKACGR